MNRLIRIILYITAGCIGVGCAALVLGFALGGANDIRTEIPRQLGYVVRGTADKVRDRVHGQKTDSDDEYAYEYGEDQDYEEQTDYGQQMILGISSSEVQSIEIDLKHGYLAIEESEDGQVQVTTGMPDAVSAECDAGTVVIKDERTGRESREDAYVYLYIPESCQFQSVSIQTGAGHVETNCYFKTEHFTLNADAGVVYLSEITADVFTASVGAGEILIEDSVFGTVTLDCGVGVMDIEADINGNTQIDCGMGSVNVELEDGADSVDYVLKCGAGNIEIDDNAYSGFSKERRVDNGASVLFTLNCGMGQICIE